MSSAIRFAGAATVAVLTLFLGSLGCVEDMRGGPGPFRLPKPAVETAVIGKPFSLAYGGDQLVLPDGIEVRFEELVMDGRCPTGAMCVWEGMAQIRLLFRSPVFSPVIIEPVIYGGVSGGSADRHTPLDTLGYRVTLQQLDPYPVIYQPADSSDYTALLLIERR